jgi:hypothetical protein
MVDTWVIVVMIILVLVILGLIFGVFYFYQHPTDINLIPYNIYGGINAPIPGRNSQGILNQADTIVNITSNSNANETTSQWYLLPIVDKIVFQNVSSKEYIMVNNTTLIVSMTNNIGEATEFFWQIDQQDGSDFFVCEIDNITACNGKFFYLTFVSVGTTIKITCVQGASTGIKWAVAPSFSPLVG